MKNVRLPINTDVTLDMYVCSCFNSVFHNFIFSHRVDNSATAFVVLSPQKHAFSFVLFNLLFLSVTAESMPNPEQQFSITFFDMVSNIVGVNSE